MYDGSMYTPIIQTIHHPYLISSLIFRFNSIKHFVAAEIAIIAGVIRRAMVPGDVRTLISSSGLNSEYGSYPFGITSEIICLLA